MAVEVTTLDPTLIGLIVVGVVVIVFILLKKSSESEPEDDKKQQTRRKKAFVHKPKGNALKKGQRPAPVRGYDQSSYEGEDEADAVLEFIKGKDLKRMQERELQAVAVVSKSQKQQPEKQETKKAKKNEKKDDEEEYVLIKAKIKKPEKKQEEDGVEAENKPKSNKNFYNKKALKELLIEAKGGKIEDFELLEEPEKKKGRGRPKKIDGAAPDNDGERPPRRERPPPRADGQKPPEGEAPRRERPPRKDGEGGPNERGPRPPREPRPPRKPDEPPPLYHIEGPSIEDLLNSITLSSKEKQQKLPGGYAKRPGGPRGEPMNKEGRPQKPKEFKEPKGPKEPRKEETPNIFSQKLERYLVMKIADFLPVKDVVALSATCRFFHRMMQNETLWKNLCLKDNVKRTASWRASYIRSKTKPPPKKEWKINQPVQPDQQPVEVPKQ